MYLYTNNMHNVNHDLVLTGYLHLSIYIKHKYMHIKHTFDIEVNHVFRFQER